MKILKDLPHAQRERLAFIDFTLSYFGEVTRADLIAKFQTGLAAATRDFATYKEYAPNNLELIHQSKSYHRTANFKPLFVHEPDTVLTGLARGFGDGLSTKIKPSQSCIEPQQLNHPSTNILSAVMRAITQKQTIQVKYISLTSGQSSRVIIPHSLANNGTRWHVRAYDKQSSSFRDFVITRIQSVEQLDDVIDESVESISADEQWNTIIELILIAHPKALHPEAIELDYAMVKGQVNIESRAALAGYLLNQWKVDCSRSYSLNPNQYHLALQNLHSIQTIVNSNLAPGYEG